MSRPASAAISSSWQRKRGRDQRRPGAGRPDLRHQGDGVTRGGDVMSTEHEKSPVVTIGRRELFELGAAVGVALLAGSEASAQGGTVPSAGLAPLPATDGTAIELLRMQADIRRALQKPVEQRGWIMVVDGRKCVGCQACVVACTAENVLPPGVSYRSVPEIEVGTYPNVK